MQQYFVEKLFRKERNNDISSERKKEQHRETERKNNNNKYRENLCGNLIHNFKHSAHFHNGSHITRSLVRSLNTN